MDWRWFRFDELGVDRLYDVLALRSRVFVVEQNCPYLDADGIDRHAWHLLGTAPGQGGGGPLLAYLRLVDPGRKFDEPSLGRVIVAPDVRGQGHGAPLMREGIAMCERIHPGRAICISAQAHLARFYAGLGFRSVGEPYLEDNIPHLDMLRPGRPT